MKVLLIGLNHSFQLEGFNSEWELFKNYLSDRCLEENPDLIAEELNIEAIELWKANDSVARRIANSLGIGHLFCDPDSSEREKIGIKSIKEIASDLGYGHALTSQESEKVEIMDKKQWDKREKYWLSRLLEKDFQKCIFIVGSDHVDSFYSKLKENKIETQILTNNWKP